MNWNEIDKKYPEAFKNCIRFKGYQETSNRDLYDFFDENNLNIYICPEYYVDGINWCWAVYSHVPTDKLCFDGTGLYGDNSEHPERVSAEEAAFEKAFEILETKLNK